MNPHVLILEDEEDLSDLVSLHLQREGLRVSCFADGAQGMGAIERELPDLLVLDLMLPGMNGLEICRRMRASDEMAEIPILILSARGEQTDIITGLELGADDYVVKPFSPRELVARVRALLRRTDLTQAETEVIELGAIRLNAERHEVSVEGRQLTLTYTEFLILRYLLGKPGRVRSRGEILEAIGEKHVLERTIDVHVATLRRKLGSSGTRIETVRGLGYRARD